MNKWERAGSYPDITLLPVLARTLGVDLNTLLSFQEDLTDQEIGTFLNTLHEAARAEGFDAAFARAEEKLREFPGNDRLAYSVAVLLEGLSAAGRSKGRRRSAPSTSAAGTAPTPRFGSGPSTPWPSAC